MFEWISGKHEDERAEHECRADRCPELDQVAGVRRRREHLRDPRWCDPPGVRPADGLHDPAHPGAARAGRRPRRAGVRRRHGQGRRLHGHQRSRRHQPGHAVGRRTHGLGPDRRDHRSGRRGRHRHRRLPGSRHPRHHDAGHQAQLPRHQPCRHPAHDRGGVLHRLDRPARPGPGRRREVGTDLDDDLPLAHRAQPARLPAGDPTALQADPGGGEADPGVASPGPVRRRRRDPGPGVQGAARPCRVHRHARGHHADGARRLPRQPPTAPRDARHARHRRRCRQPAEERPDDQPRCAVRRPGDRQPRLVRAGRQGDPRRHRPRRDRQEPLHRRTDRR